VALFDTLLCDSLLIKQNYKKNMENIKKKNLDNRIEAEFGDVFFSLTNHARFIDASLKILWK